MNKQQIKEWQNGALGQPIVIVRGGRREEGSGWWTHVYLWQIHVDTWQNQYNIVKLKHKIKDKEKKKKNDKRGKLFATSIEEVSNDDYIHWHFPLTVIPTLEKEIWRD